MVSRNYKKKLNEDNDLVVKGISEKYLSRKVEGQKITTKNYK